MLVTLMAMPGVSVSADDEADASGSGMAKWTIMVYLDADNNLEGAGIEDLNELELAGSTDEVNLVVLMDRTEGESSEEGDWTGGRLYHVQKDDDLGSFYPYEEGVNMWRSEEDWEPNMGDPETLINFTAWAIDNFPAEHYFLDMWNHGGAFWGVCWDDTSGADGDCLEMTELAYALSRTKEHLGRSLDIVGFDACFMGQTAVMYQIADYCDIGIGSAFSEPGDGWPYEYTMPSLVKKPAMTPEELSRTLVDDYITSYTDRSSNPDDSTRVTLGAFDMQKFRVVAQRLNEFAMALSLGTPLSNPTLWYKQIDLARTRAYSYDLVPVGPFDMSGYCMYDIIDFLDKLDVYAPMVADAVSEEAARLHTAIIDATIHSRANTAQFNANCLTVYLPKGTQTVYDPEFDLTRLAREMYWDEFLNLFAAGTSFAENTPPAVYLESPKDGDVLGWGNRTIEVSGTSYDAQGSVVQVQIKVDDGDWVTASGTLDWSHVIRVEELEEGRHDIAVKAFDGEEWSGEALTGIYKEVPIEETVAVEPAGAPTLAIALIVVAIVGAAIAIAVKRRM